jgi:hypothetical protein
MSFRLQYDHHNPIFNLGVSSLTQQLAGYSVRNAVSQLLKVHVCRGVDKSLAFPILYLLTCSTTKRIVLGWVKEVRTTKS